MPEKNNSSSFLPIKDLPSTSTNNFISFVKNNKKHKNIVYKCSYPLYWAIGEINAVANIIKKKPKYTCKSCVKEDNIFIEELCTFCYRRKNLYVKISASSGIL